MGLLSKSNKKPQTGNKEHTRKSTDRSICCDNMSFAAKEAYKRLRTNIVFSFSNENKCRIIGITSAQPSEGKTISSVNLAYSLAEFGQRVLLIDGDLRRSSVHVKLKVPQTPGLSNLLVETSDIKSVINICSYKNDVSFDVITGGKIPPNPSELLASNRMNKLLISLSSVYDYIIIDLPPVGAVIDPIAVSKFLDGMIIVIREDHTTRFELSDCIEQMKLADIKIIGFVNNGSLEGSSKKYKSKKYGHRY
ncbi:MAG: CpsD/CapB family tyrosine-protein kinase, partial [Eubacteriales bacterium]|nr:CpsD/CapB family tyrosine-protein kinase [Eubacteriales bacterium]